MAETANAIRRMLHFVDFLLGLDRASCRDRKVSRYRITFPGTFMEAKADC
jgi:hypothetical protein